jgi:hypothetical protein
VSVIDFPCPSCGQTYQLDDAYVARYGGQETVCTACLEPMVVPRTFAAQGGPPPLRSEGHSAGKQVLSYATPYAGPQPAVAGMPVWRDKGAFVTVDKTSLPDVCVKCGAHGRGRRYRRTYYWHEPLVYLTILAGLLLYIILAMVVRKKATVEFSLCETHAAKRRNGILGGWAVVGLGILMFVGAGAGVIDEPAALVVLGIVCVFGGLIAASMAARTLYPQKIQKPYVWLRGSGKPFREMFPFMR